jgi:site-specific recombinase XerD
LGKVTEKSVDKLNHQYKGKQWFSLHSLRATFATRLCEQGVSTRIVQDLLGHSDPKTTLRYAAVSQAAAFDAVQRL